MVIDGQIQEIGKEQCRGVQANPYRRPPGYKREGGRHVVGGDSGGAIRE